MDRIQRGTWLNNCSEQVSSPACLQLLLREDKMIKTQHDIIAYYPYGCGDIIGSKSAIVMTEALKAWRKELCAAIGVQPDNKTTFKLLAGYGGYLVIQFWDWVVYFGNDCRVKPGRMYLEVDNNGTLVERLG